MSDQETPDTEPTTQPIYNYAEYQNQTLELERCRLRFEIAQFAITHRPADTSFQDFMTDLLEVVFDGGIQPNPYDGYN